MNTTGLSLLPDENEFIDLIEEAKNDVSKDLSKLRIDVSKHPHPLSSKANQFRREFHYEDIDKADSVERQWFWWWQWNRGIRGWWTELSGITGQILMKDYSKPVDEEGPYTIVLDSTGKENVACKSTIVWYLAQDKHKLWGKFNQKPTLDFEEITTLEWCLFYIYFILLTD